MSDYLIIWGDLLTFKKEQIGFIDKLSIYRSNFRNSINSAATHTFNFTGINGSSVKNNIKPALKAALGEHVERVCLYKNIKTLKKKEVLAFNFLTNEQEYIPNKYVSLTFIDDVFFENDEERNNFYNDSTGVASHLNSNMAIKNSYFEFVERQSLVFSFLTKTPGTRVIYDEMHIEKNDMLRSAYLYFDEVVFYDISLFDGIYVIIGIGLGSKYYGVGLSADRDLNKAFTGALDELMACVFRSIPKDYTNQNRNNIDTPEINRDAIFKDPHFYSNVFFSKLNSDYIKKSFSYLQCEKKVYLSERIVDSQGFDVIKDARNFAQKYNINLYLVYIPITNINYPNKVVKFLSPDCYLHINTLLIKPEDYSISYMRDANQKFPNKNIYLPFP